MKYALFLGCTIPVRAQNYEMSARKVAEALGIELVDIDEFGCCGFPVKSTDTKATTLLAARNLAFAYREGLEICTLCNACTGILTHTAKELDSDEKLRSEINEELKQIGLEYKPGIKVRHFSRILFEEFGTEKISKMVTADMSGFSFSIHYGCHYIRPQEIYDGFEDPENPVTVEKLTEATGAGVKDYQGKLTCCGGAILGVEQDIALKMAGKKLGNVIMNGVDALITICPFCTIMYDDNQKKIEEVLEKEFNLPVLYYPQVLGLAMGLNPKELGFRLNKVKTKDLLQKYEDANPTEPPPESVSEEVSQ